MMQPGQPSQAFPGFFQQPGQQEMMAQMMMMQANMAQMGEMMTHMMEVSRSSLVLLSPIAKEELMDVGEAESATSKCPDPDQGVHL
jgi:hypothetical protein